MSKSTAYLMCFIAICTVMFIGTAVSFYEVIIVKNHLDDVSVISLVPISQCLTALVSMTTLYIGGSVVNNGVKGKFYREELDTNVQGDKNG